MNTRVEITKDMIKKGRREDARRCPLAIGFRRAAPGCNPDVLLSYVWFRYEFKVKLPKKARLFRAKYDAKEPVKPLSFLINIPNTKGPTLPTAKTKTTASRLAIEERILVALRASGEWTTVAELAKAMGWRPETSKTTIRTAAESMVVENKLEWMLADRELTSTWRGGCVRTKNVKVSAYKAKGAAS